MIYKNPAWSSLKPALPTLEPVRDGLSSRMLESLKLAGNVYKVYFQNNLTSNYVVHAADKARLFIKLINKANLPYILAAADIEQWLNKENAVPAGFLPQFSSLLDESTYMAVYPFIEGRRPEPSINDCAGIGRGLARLHQRLAGYVKTEAIKTSTTERIAKLEWCRQQIIAGKLHAKIHSQRLKNLAQKVELSFGDPNCDAMSLHGDLNLGNILIDDNDAVHFFDYEDTLHSFLPVAYELCFLIERLILVNVEDDEAALELGRRLINAYRQQGGVYHYKVSDKYYLEALQLRSLCTLVLCELQNIDIDISEWEKFYFLLDMAEKRSKLIEAILTS